MEEECLDQLKELDKQIINEQDKVLYAFITVH